MATQLSRLRMKIVLCRLRNRSRGLRRNSTRLGAGLATLPQWNRFGDWTGLSCVAVEDAAAARMVLESISSAPEREDLLLKFSRPRMKRQKPILYLTDSHHRMA